MRSDAEVWTRGGHSSGSSCDEGACGAQVLCRPSSLGAKSKFQAELYVLTKEEGGRHTPFFSDYSPQLFIRTADVTGSLSSKPLCLGVQSTAGSCTSSMQRHFWQTWCVRGFMLGPSSCVMMRQASATLAESCVMMQDRCTDQPGLHALLIAFSAAAWCRDDHAAGGRVDGDAGRQHGRDGRAAATAGARRGLLRFALREGGRTVGAGVITRVLD